MIARLSLDLRSGGLIFVSGGIGLLAVLAVGSALVLARPGWIAGALALLALAYFGHVLLTGESDLATLGVVSVALLLVGELSQWSMDSRLAGRYDGRLHWSRAIGVALLGSVALAILFMSWLAVGVPIEPGVWIVAVAVAAMVALLGLVSAVALRGPSGRDPS